MSRTEVADGYLEKSYELDVREASFVERLKANEDAACDELYRMYRDPVARIACRMMGDSNEASAVIQEIFLKVFRNIRNFRGDTSLRTWIYRIAFSEIVKQLRWWRSGYRFSVMEISPERALKSNEGDAIILHGLGRLSRDRRSILILRDIEGFSYSEISDVLGLSTGTVKSRLARARADLKKAVAPYVSL